jgi:hypothetical protein
MAQSYLFKLLAFSLIIYSQSTIAANLYRCGNSYQDTPCKDSASSKPVKKIAQSSNQVTQHIDADCKQRGDEAKKIMWAREVGKTADQQIEEAQNGYSKGLIREVYTHRGSSLEVKNAIEKECMVQKEQDRAANALIEAALKSRGDKNASLENSSASKSDHNASQDQDQTEQKVSAKATTSAAHDKTIKCSDLKYRVEKIVVKRRTGGGARYMNDLRMEQEQLEANMKSLAC